MMMSEHSYPSFKKVNWRTRRSLPWVFVAIVVLVSAVNFWKIVPFVIFLSYLTYGCVRPWISRQWRREIEDGDEEFEPEIVSADKESLVENPRSDESAA
jgi:CDP-diacylglycerol---serine O-phosphatidyltransferase